MAAARSKRQGQARRRPSGGRSSAPPWLWMLGGFLPGVFLAALVHLHHSQEAAIAVEPDGARNTAGAAGQDTDQRPRFEFYRLLSEMEVVVPDEPPEPRRPRQQTTAAAAPPPPSPPAAGTPEGGGEQQQGRYVVQAGSFRNYSDADRLKARLALLGVEAEIQSVTIDGAGTWHRVRIGPLSDRSRVERVRQRLEEERVESILLRVQG